MPSCRIPFCDKKCNYDKNRHLFGLPKDEELLKKWHQILGPFFQKNGLHKTTRICNLHFRPQDIETKFKHVIDGRVIEIDRERARLVGNAIPLFNLPNEEEMLAKREESRGRPSKNKSMMNISNQKNTNYKVNLTESIKMTEQSIDTVTIDSLKNDDTDKQNTLTRTNSSFFMLCDFETIYASKNVKLPPLWAIHRCPEKSKIIYSYMDVKKMSATKIISIDKNYIISIVIDGRIVTEELLQPQDKDTIQSITNILEFIDQT